MLRDVKVRKPLWVYLIKIYIRFQGRREGGGSEQ
jgi:hypothetical protein